MRVALEAVYHLVSIHFLTSLGAGATAGDMEAAVLVSPTRRILATGSSNQRAITDRPVRKLKRPSNRMCPTFGPSDFSESMCIQCDPTASVDSGECRHCRRSSFGNGSFLFDLWLDLTGTAISPSDSAVQVLHTAILSSIATDKVSSSLKSSRFWKKVVVGGGDCISACSDSFRSVACREVLPDATVSNECTFHSAIVTGDILQFQAAGMIDPLLALDAVVAGKWLMIDCSADDSKSNDPFPDRLECLLEFLSSAASSRYPSGSARAFDSVGQRRFGGVSIRCRDIAGLVHCFRVLTRNLSFYHSATTESGLLVPSSRVSKFRSSDEKKREAPAFGVSIALPLDSHLWETALSFIENTCKEYDGS